jgi:hypothetical protein
VPKAAKLAGIGTTFLAGVLLAAMVASGGFATDTTTTVETTTTETTTPEPSTSVETSTTVETTPTADTTTVSVTTTRLVPVATEESSSGTATWVWVLLAILGVTLVALVVMLARRGGGSGGGGGPGGTPRAKLDAAVGSWAAQGWAIESQTSDSAVLRHGGETMLVSVDESGHVSTRPLTAPS